MAELVNESAPVLENKLVGPRLHLMKLQAPIVAQSVQPGQFVHMKIPGREAHVLRRPFSIYDCDGAAGTCEILYQEVGSLTEFMTRLSSSATVELLGPVGQGWTAPQRVRDGRCARALLVGGGVGAAPLYLLGKALVEAGVAVDVVLGAQTRDALVCHGRYARLCGIDPACSTDDGSFGTAGFATGLVQERLDAGCMADGAPYDYMAVCGPTPLMKIAADQAEKAGVYCEVSLERFMACGLGACLSCVVDTTEGKRRSCVDGPVFDSRKVVWQ